MSDYINQADIPVTETLAEALGFDADGNWAKMVPANPADVQATQNAAAEARTAASNAQTSANEARTLAKNAETAAGQATKSANNAQARVNEVAVTAETLAAGTAAGRVFGRAGLNTIFPSLDDIRNYGAMSAVNGAMTPVAPYLSTFNFSQPLEKDIHFPFGMPIYISGVMTGGLTLTGDTEKYAGGWKNDMVKALFFLVRDSVIAFDFDTKQCLMNELGIGYAGWKVVGGSGGGLTVSDLLNNGDFLNKVAERASNEAVRKAAASQLGVDYMTAFRELDADDQDAILSALEGSTNAENAALAAAASVKLIANMFNFSWNTGVNPLREEAADA